MKHHGPAPLIEDHYHIRDLIERQEKRTDDRVRYQNQEKEKQERESVIREAPFVKLEEFWCDTCKEDFKGVAFKDVEDDWTAEGQHIAFYKTKCFKGHTCIRLITDKHIDPYFVRSRFVSLDRGKYSRDVLQPFEEGFNMLFGKK